jgi:hypothetical protein
MALVDTDERPLLLNQKVLDEVVDPRFTVELNRFNLEYNSSPAGLSGRPFRRLATELETAIGHVRRVASTHHGRAALVGISPTLARSDFGPHAMTDLPRYHALDRALTGLRHGPFRVCINGADPLEFEHDDVTLEGANTSLQLHLTAPPEKFSDLYNAVQLATAPVLAVCGNSPLLLGHRLWQETRIALFKQSVDARHPRARIGEPRVSFGHAWVRGGVLELFQDLVTRFEPILPVMSEEDPLERLHAGAVPRLSELRLHAGTVWHWNRPVFDPVDTGHLRVELRAMPSGPTVVDMIANATFAAGLSLGLLQDAPLLTRVMPFDVAHANFYRAAEHGLDVELRWPDTGGRLRVVKIRDILPELLNRARAGLESVGVEAADFAPQLALVEDRVARGQTGALWQLRRFEALNKTLSCDEALAGVLREYLTYSEQEVPVHQWPA